MAAPSEEKLICDKFYLEALTVNQVKVSKLWQTGKMFSLEPKREVANRCHMRAFRCHLCLHFVDNMCSVWNVFWLDTCTGSRNQWNIKARILKMYSRSAKGGDKGDPNRNPWLAKMDYTMTINYQDINISFPNTRLFIILKVRLYHDH
jgi:hypothetical protein